MTLEAFEDEYSRPFLVHGQRYLDELYATAARAAPPARAKTPSNTSMPGKPATLSKSTAPRIRAGTIHGQPPGRSKTPVSNNFGASVSRTNFGSSVMSSAPSVKSPSKIPSRSQLGQSTRGGNASPERRPPAPSREDSQTLRRGDSQTLRREDSQTMRGMPPPMAPPPRMKDLFVPPPSSDTPTNLRFQFNRGERSDSIVRNVPPEDPYDDRPYSAMSQSTRPGYAPSYNPTPSLSSASSRQISQTSSAGTAATMQSGSENWETFSERSDDLPESEVDFQSYRQRQMKRYTPEGGHSASPRAVQGKKVRSIRSVDDGQLMMENNGRMVRVIEGSEAGWTDDGDY
jgi:protein regulator of cytokinesis 1